MIILISKESVWEQLQHDPGLYGSQEVPIQVRESHVRQKTTLQEVESLLTKTRVPYFHVVGAGSYFSAQPGDTVVVVGGDGTFLAASHYVGANVKMIGINSDPYTSKGHFCVGTLYGLERLLAGLVPDEDFTRVTRMRVAINGKHVVSNRVLNEILFSHSCPAAMTRFDFKGRTISCSGIWIGTAAGSTGAISSAGGLVRDIADSSLQAIIREPTESMPGAILGSEFEVRSKVPDATIYVDGPFLRTSVRYGELVSCIPSEEPLMVYPVRA